MTDRAPSSAPAGAVANDAIAGPLARVRTRQRLARAGRWAAWGLVPSAVVGATLGVLNVTGAATIPPWAALAALAAGPVLGGLAGLLWTSGLHRAAAAVDAHYDLKDRATTALAWSKTDSPWAALQRSDAAERLKTIEPAAVVPFRPGRRLAVGSLAVAAVVGLALFPAPRQASADVAGPNEDLLAIAADVEAQIDELEEEIAEQSTPELEELIEELRERVEQMKEPTADAREVLAELSRMEESIRQRTDESGAAVTANLQALAAAMEAAEALRPAAEALKQEDFEQAAQMLEEAAPADAPRRERKAAAERMRKAAGAMSAAGLSRMSQATEQTADGMNEGNAAKASNGAKSLAKQMKQAATRQKLNRALRRQLDRLGECKGQCAACMSPGDSEGNGSSAGRGQGNGNSLARGQGNRSDSPSNNFGMKDAGNVNDPASLLNGNRTQEEVTGVAGDGPSDYETSKSPEGRETARRGYAERYSEYQKRSEEVLENEAIPLGHRRLIRDYFEAIRPTAADRAALDAAE
ncbi:hypothetical protein [Alienimonas sp. DA493]|uniref:hypothetical protein n=1 Tax=Alienimonas sp. DA493 TaxID=3373605 RepID=UPI0037540F2E